ncbi:PRC-barrel domain containing protein [Streptomyces sp. NPDC048507]|uniref:PRC-barrel domain-containing protein n=1 Tax=Streptomyces sp. NPDC048507 TaxID=3365560 RepID=UPI00371ABE33
MTGHVWSYKSPAGRRDGLDLTGFKVEATDGSVGKVDAHNDEAGDAYLVVDTGVWIFGKEVLLPASTVVSVDAEARTVFVDRTRAQIKAAPLFIRENHLTDPRYREQLGAYYGYGVHGTGGPTGGRVI